MHAACRRPVSARFRSIPARPVRAQPTTTSHGRQTSHSVPWRVGEGGRPHTNLPTGWLLFPQNGALLLPSAPVGNLAVVRRPSSVRTTLGWRSTRDVLPVAGPPPSGPRPTAASRLRALSRAAVVRRPLSFDAPPLLATAATTTAKARHRFRIFSASRLHTVTSVRPSAFLPWLRLFLAPSPNAVSSSAQPAHP